MAQLRTVWQLAIECSASGGSLAFLKRVGNQQPMCPEAPTLQLALPEQPGSVCSLAPAIQHGLSRLGLSVDELDFLSVTSGPGSFTGLRVGLTTAKMLAWASHKPIVPVDTLAAIAQRFADRHIDELDKNPSPVRLVTAINAFRKQVFTARWIVQSGAIQCIEPSHVIDASKWLSDPWGNASNDVRPGDESTDLWITGGALLAHPHPCQNDWKIAPRELWQPMAEQVGHLGWLAFDAGHQLNAAQLNPNYIRASAAEEKRKT